VHITSAGAKKKQGSQTLLTFPKYLSFHQDFLSFLDYDSGNEYS
jgi:hypothetical protein